MPDIELVIKISKEDFEIMKHNVAVNNPLCPLSQEEMVTTIANGTPLLKEKGEWIPLHYKDEMWGYVYKCSNCGATEYKDNFCPNCGIRMIEPARKWGEDVRKDLWQLKEESDSNEHGNENGN